MDSGVGARAFLIARDLIARHGVDLARFLQEVDALIDAPDCEQLFEWFIIRNADVLSLGTGATVQ